MLLAIPFWIIVMGFAFAGLLRLRLPLEFKSILLGVSASILACGFFPSAKFIYGETKSPFSIGSFGQQNVAASRFLRDVVAGKQPANPPRLERDEFNRAEDIPDVPYDTLICLREVNTVGHLFLHDYDDTKILSFCGGIAFNSMTQQDIWGHNKQAIVDYVPNGKNLKLIWESDPQTELIVKLLRPLGDPGTEKSISFSFGEGVRTFDVLNIGNKNIHQFQERVKELPATLDASPAKVSSLPKSANTVFEGAIRTEKNQFALPRAICVDGKGDILVSNTGNGRIKEF